MCVFGPFFESCRDSLVLWIWIGLDGMGLPLLAWTTMCLSCLLSAWIGWVGAVARLGRNIGTLGDSKHVGGQSTLGNLRIPYVVCFCDL